MDISERKLQILQAIITDYVKSAEPVGSRSLAKKYGLGVSPATIRNEMADACDSLSNKAANCGSVVIA